ncbi:MAG: DUF1318 domain-containing protein [Deltaproteobacteria bacterium]|nr:DUF1318 domain-containing protein [Deltaproteobacteria bacterium]
MKRVIVKSKHLLFVLVCVVGLPACTFNFNVTGSRSALENQVMGSYKELDDDLILASSVRGPNVPVVRKPAVDARLNQQFNQDDIGELADLGLIGETSTGMVVLLPSTLASGAKVSPSQLQLARKLIGEENRDRAIIWQRIIAANPNLHASDLPEVQKTYAKIRRQVLAPGQWFQDDRGTWQKKIADVSKSS